MTLDAKFTRKLDRPLRLDDGQLVDHISLVLDADGDQLPFLILKGKGRNVSIIELRPKMEEHR